jgi:hypothetical protein
MRIFDLHTSKARYELKKVSTPPLARECQNDWRIYYTPLAISSEIKLRHNNITDLRLTGNWK